MISIKAKSERGAQEGRGEKFLFKKPMLYYK